MIEERYLRCGIELVQRNESGTDPEVLLRAFPHLDDCGQKKPHVATTRLSFINSKNLSFPLVMQRFPFQPLRKAKRTAAERARVQKKLCKARLIKEKAEHKEVIRQMKAFPICNNCHGERHAGIFLYDQEPAHFIGNVRGRPKACTSEPCPSLEDCQDPFKDFRATTHVTERADQTIAKLTQEDDHLAEKELMMEGHLKETMPAATVAARASQDYVLKDGRCAYLIVAIAD